MHVAESDAPTRASSLTHSRRPRTSRGIGVFSQVSDRSCCSRLSWRDLVSRRLGSNLLLLCIFPSLKPHLCVRRREGTRASTSPWAGLTGGCLFLSTLSSFVRYPLSCDDPMVRRRLTSPALKARLRVTFNPQLNPPGSSGPSCRSVFPEPPAYAARTCRSNWQLHFLPPTVAIIP